MNLFDRNSSACAILACVTALGPVAVIADDAPNQKTATPIQHVVVIFQENVSFDHYFGTYPHAANNNPSEPLFRPAAPGTPPTNGSKPRVCEKTVS